jgi:hypothetical protein
MPVIYDIDKANGMIHTKCVGAVTHEEVIGHFRQLEADPDCPSHLNVLLDLTEQTSLPNVGNLREVAQEIRRVRHRVRFGVCAIVAPGNALYGMLRMFEVFTEPYFHQAAVFRTVPEAEAWLASRIARDSAAG